MPEPNQRLRDAREASPSRRVPGACLSRAELAEAVNAWLYEQTGEVYDLDRTLVAKWESGYVGLPSAAYRAALRAILCAGSDAELGFGPQGRNSAPARRATVTTADAAEALRPEDEERVVHVVGKPRTVDHTTLESLADVLAGVRRLEDETSAADVVPSVLHQHELVQRLARDADSSLRPAAVGLASEIAQYLGWLSIPLQRWEDSRRHLDRAVVLAMEADDPLRLATALSFQAYRAMLSNDLPTADALSATAGRDTRVDPGLRTYMAFQRAEVLAKRRDRDAALRRLSQAERLVEQLPPADELPSSGYWYTPAIFAGHRGFVLHALGDLPAARRAAAECLAAMPASWRMAEWAAPHRALAEEE